MANKSKKSEKASTKQNPAEKRSISFPRELMEQGERRAAEMNRSFSNYIQSLVLADLGRKEAA